MSGLPSAAGRPAPRPPDRFLRLADWISWAMGTPANIAFWTLAIAVWFALGAALPRLFTAGTFLPAWFTSTNWNFPINSTTTIAELLIGFLVAAATNRAQRVLMAILAELLEHSRWQAEHTARLEQVEAHVLRLEEQIARALGVEPRDA